MPTIPPILPGIHPAPNIQETPDIYEIENHAVDPDHRIDAAMWAIAPWQSATVLDLCAGTGFHIARFHERAEHVFAVEPHAPSRLRAMARVVALGLERASVVTGSAEQIPLADSSIDIVHARFAYFFAPHCAKGLPELERVIRPGGTAFIIDNDLRHGTFAAWLQRVPGGYFADADTVEQWWADNGFIQTRIMSRWHFASLADLAAVIRIEFPPALAEELISEHQSTIVEYGYCLYHRHY